MKCVVWVTSYWLEVISPNSCWFNSIKLLVSINRFEQDSNFLKPSDKVSITGTLFNSLENSYELYKLYKLICLLVKPAADSTSNENWSALKCHESCFEPKRDYYIFCINPSWSQCYLGIYSINLNIDLMTSCSASTLIKRLKVISYCFMQKKRRVIMKF